MYVASKRDTLVEDLQPEDMLQHMTSAIASEEVICH